MLTNLITYSFTYLKHPSISISLISASEMGTHILEAPIPTITSLPPVCVA